jgi:hypothetical protein
VWRPLWQPCMTNGGWNPDWFWKYHVAKIEITIFIYVYIYIHICIYIYHTNPMFWPWHTWSTDFCHALQTFFSICSIPEGTAVSRVSEPQAGILMKIYLWSYQAELDNFCIKSTARAGKRGLQKNVRGLLFFKCVVLQKKAERASIQKGAHFIQSICACSCLLWFFGLISTSYSVADCQWC